METEVPTKREMISERVSEIANDFQEVSSATKRMAADSLDAVRKTATQFLGEGRTKVREAGKSVHSKVQEKPGRSMLIAAAVGFLVGILWMRR